MVLAQFVEAVSRKFAWSFIGVMLALIFGGTTIYSEFIEDKRPTLQFDVLTNTSVLDVREQLSNLNILFDGIDIRKQNLSLRVITTRIINNSSIDILKGHYDSNAPLGLHVSTGKVIKTELVGASNDYLREHLTIDARDDQTILFSSVILDAGQSFTLKLLVLHPKGQIPNLDAVGKIAGIKAIPVLEAFKDGDTESLVTVAFRGSFLVQVVRFFSYAFGGFLLLAVVLAAITIPIVVISNKLIERKRKKEVQEFKRITSAVLNESDEFIFTKYVNNGKYAIQTMHLLVTDARYLVTSYAFSLEFAPKKREIVHHRHMEISELEDIERDEFSVSEDFDEYFSVGLIRKTENGVMAGEHLTNTLKHFFRFLRNKGLFSSHKFTTDDKDTGEAEPDDSADESR